MTLQSSVINTAFKSARGRKNRKRTSSIRNQGSLPDTGPFREPAEVAPSAPTVYGPYADGGRWRIIAVDGEVRRALKTDTLAEAERMRDEILAEFKRHTVCTFGEALKEYEESLLARGVQSAQHNAEMLRRFLPLRRILAIPYPNARRVPVSGRDEANQRQRSSRSQRHAPPAVAAHQILLWVGNHQAVRQSESVRRRTRSVGRTKRGKLQLRIDEARKLVTVAMQHATALDVGSTAAVLQIFLGLASDRSSGARRSRSR